MANRLTLKATHKQIEKVEGGVEYLVSLSGGLSNQSVTVTGRADDEGSVEFTVGREYNVDFSKVINTRTKAEERLEEVNTRIAEYLAPADVTRQKALEHLADHHIAMNEPETFE